jgi:hypothetical protein
MQTFLIFLAANFAAIALANLLIPGSSHRDIERLGILGIVLVIAANLITYAALF